MVEMSQVDTEARAEVETSSQASVSESRVASAKRDERPVYEVGFHVVPDVAEGKVSEVVEKIRAQLQKGNAEIITEASPRKTSLAYTVERATTGKREKYNDAYFGFIKFATERENIPAIETLLRSTKEILRYLLIETTREEAVAAPRRAIFTSDRLEGETIKKPVSAPEKGGEVSEEELNKSIEALVS